MGLRVELFARIRRDARVKGWSIRTLARQHRVSRRTVRQALVSSEPPARRTPVRTAPKLDKYKAVIDQMLTTDLDAPRKQRHTAQRVFDRLVDEHWAVISYSTVRQYVKSRRAEIAFETGNAPLEVFVPQEHAPGAEAEVDFGDVWVDIAGVRTRCYMLLSACPCLENRSTACIRPARRRHSWRATSKHSTLWAGSQRSTSDMTT